MLGWNIRKLGMSRLADLLGCESALDSCMEWDFICLQEGYHQANEFARKFQVCGRHTAIAPPHCTATKPGPLVVVNQRLANCILDFRCSAGCVAEIGRAHV